MASARSIPGAPGLETEYEMVRELGRGGMAIVYLARERATGREVAIKLIRAMYAQDAEAIARFTREASLVEQLQHPRIVPIHAIRQLADGSIALVMERVPGFTLKELIGRHGALSVAQAERVLRDIADALGYAHAQGIVHRDVKPENIFIDETTGHAFLSDFGIARPIQSDTELTLTDVAIGTPTYMSPEQIDGPVIDGRSDLYSLGLVAWEMLAGRRPWDGENLYSIIYHQKHDPLPPLDRLRPDIPERVLAAIEGLLEKAPADRWSSADEFIAQLSAEHPAPRHAPPAWVPPPATTETIQYRRLPDREEIEVLLPPPPRSRRRALIIAALIGIPASLIGGMMLLAARDGYDVNRGIAIVTDAPRRIATQWSSRAASTGNAAGGELAAPEDVRVTPDSAGRAIDSSVSPTASGDSAPPSSSTTPDTVMTADSQSPARPSASPSGAAGADAGDRVTVVAGGVDTCLLTGDGDAYCWGGNDQGQLGNGRDARAATPTKVAGGLRFASISPGLSHSCAITTGGTGYCWGANDHGQLGNGTLTSSTTPVRVAGRLRFRTLQAGVSHSCGLTTSGTIYCWGAGGSGQLGNGDVVNERTPVQVADTVRFTQLAVGWNHSCALDEAGTAYCWGQNTSGQIGDGTAINRSTPTVVSGDLHFVAITAGGSHSCALTADGQAYCWGSNRYGELGDGGTADHATPTRVASGGRFVAITAGGVHTCAITANGGAQCWGRNSDGQLGDGTTIDRAIPVPVAGDLAFRTISATGAHSCATTSTGESFCWGSNVEGQLGDGSRTHRTTPVSIGLPNG